MQINKNIHSFFARIPQKTQGDKNIWACVTLLYLFSMLFVYSASGFINDIDQTRFQHYLGRQFLFILLSVLVMYFTHRIRYTLYAKIAPVLLGISVLLLLYTLLFGLTINNGIRWVKIPILNVTFQTSDLAKTALIIFLASQLADKKDKLHHFKQGFLPMGICVVVVSALVAPSNLSTALIIVASAVTLLFIGGAKATHLIMFFGSIFVLPVVILITIAVTHYDKTDNRALPLPTYLNVNRLPVWIKRIQSYLYDHGGEDNYQADQAKIAIRNGGLLGKGPGKSDQKYFLPLAYSDFIYAIIIEEYGMVTGIFIVCLYLLLLFRCLVILRRCTDLFGGLLAIGLGGMLVIQAMVNICTNLSMIPVTGIGLPLISMGGSSYVLTGLSIGIILSVARCTAKKQKNEAFQILQARTTV